MLQKNGPFDVKLNVQLAKTMDSNVFNKLGRHGAQQTGKNAFKVLIKADQLWRNSWEIGFLNGHFRLGNPISRNAVTI